MLEHELMARVWLQMLHERFGVPIVSLCWLLEDARTVAVTHDVVVVAIQSKDGTGEVGGVQVAGDEAEELLEGELTFTGDDEGDLPRRYRKLLCETRGTRVR